MTFYTDVSSIAYSVIAEFGQDVTVSRSVKEVDPVYGYQYGDTVETGTFKAVNPPAAAGLIDMFEDIATKESATIYKNVRFAILAAYNTAMVPRVNDKLTMDGVDYVVFGVTPVSPAGTDIVYKLAAGR